MPWQLWHVQKYVAIWQLDMELQQNEFNIRFEFDVKKALLKQAPWL